ncbi:MAG TPA: amidase [Candidatus Elarobacter sp.]|nr:amidase [Candidatus Elarobacter sp.]
MRTLLGLSRVPGPKPHHRGRRSAPFSAECARSLMPASHDLCLLSATELLRRMERKDVSAAEVLDAHLARIEALNPSLNAIVTLDADGARAAARRADEARARGERLGALHGLPVAHKDLVLTRGMRTTFGSPIFKDFVPDQSSAIVERQQRAGAITIGKTNTPEFGAGSQTFNAVFGATRNPYDATKTCGGSSGGAAVALATGMVPLADGSDLGGSLRNPANFCNVVGLRPSVGRVAQWPTEDAWNTLSVCGPMARTVEDVALYLSVIAGADPRDPISLAEDPAQFREPLEREFRGTRVAWSRDLGGLPVERAVTVAIEAQRAAFDDTGASVEDAEPDLDGADDAFQTLRGIGFMRLADLLDTHPGAFKDTIVWNIGVGRGLTGSHVGEAVKCRSQIFARMHAFMERYEFLVLPVNQVVPFSVDLPYVTQINGVKMQNYLDWMRSCSWITVTGHPAISVPCGFTPEGLPVGVQIVGRYRDELNLLKFARAFEQRTRTGERRPPLSP